MSRRDRYGEPRPSESDRRVMDLEESRRRREIRAREEARRELEDLGLIQPRSDGDPDDAA